MPVLVQRAESAVTCLLFDSLRPGRDEGRGGDGEAAPPVPSGLVFPAYVPGEGKRVGAEVPPGHVGIEIAGGGALVRFVGEKRPGRPPVNVKRGKCRGMSKEARLRQLKFINAIDRRQVKGVIFGSLTLRGGAEGVGLVESWDLIERARRKWFKRLERFLEGKRWFAMWRKEPHLSGVAHLHVLIFFLDDPPHLVQEFRPWNDQAWAASVGDDSLTRTACSTELIRTWGGVASYLCKYLAKEQDLQDIETGKVWDVVHRQEVPIDVSQDVVKRSVSNRMQRVARKWHQRKAEAWQVKRPDDRGGFRWLTVRPWRRRDRVVSVDEQISQARDLGLRVRRRRPRLCCTREVPLWVESEGQVLPADPLLVDAYPGAYVTTVEGDYGVKTQRVVERHTYFAGAYFLPEKEARALLTWAKRREVEVLLAQADLPF